MAQIDNSIYLNRTQFDPFGSAAKGYEQGMRLAEMAKQQKKADQEMELQEGIKSAASVDPATGNISYDSVKLSDIGKKFPMQVAEIQKKQIADQRAVKEQSLTDSLSHAHMTAGLLYGVKDQAGYDGAIEHAKALGIPGVEKLPPQFDQGYVDKLRKGALTLVEQQTQDNKDREFKQKDQELGLKHEENATKREELGLAKNDKLAKDLDSHLDKGGTARSGAAGKVQGKLTDAEYAEGLIAQGKGQEGGLDSRQIEELAQSTARLLGGTGAASARVEALVPHTAWGRVQTLKEWASNKPTGAEQQDFVNRMAETIAREKAIAENQKRQFQIEGLPAHEALRKKDKALYDRILAGKGIDPSMIDEKGRYKAPPSKSDTDFHGMSDADLDAAYKAAGGK